MRDRVTRWFACPMDSASRYGNSSVRRLTCGRFDAAQRLHAARADKVWHVGRKPVFRVALASGRSIRATAEHRLLAGAGWTTVGKLATGDRLALARRLPAPAQPKRWPEHWLILLGHLVGDGSLPGASATALYDDLR